MKLYDTIMYLSHTFSITKFQMLIFFFLNENTQEDLYIIAIYKPPQMNKKIFNSISKTII
jgi:hypothetical protein